MIIGISGKKQSGKDTIGKIIQMITTPGYGDTKYPNWDFHFDNKGNSITNIEKESSWKTVRFADKLKDMVCLLFGCTREQLEDEEFKNTFVPNEWIRYGVADGFWFHSDNNPSHKIMDEKFCSKEEYELELKVNWQTAYKFHPTYREVLQYVGTDLFRKQFHPNTLVNATMADYKGQDVYEDTRFVDRGVYPNWLIPDVRFPNEVEAIKKRGGLIIRVNRVASNKVSNYNHESEVALDYYNDFDFVMNNNETIEHLIEKVEVFLKYHKLI